MPKVSGIPVTYIWSVSLSACFISEITEGSWVILVAYIKFLGAYLMLILSAEYIIYLSFNPNCISFQINVLFHTRVYGFV